MNALLEYLDLFNRRYAHFITRTKNGQLSVDGAKLDSAKEVYGKRDGLSLARVVSYCSSRICFPYFCMVLPLLSYHRVLHRLRLIDHFFVQVIKCAYHLLKPYLKMKRGNYISLNSFLSIAIPMTACTVFMSL